MSGQAGVVDETTERTDTEQVDTGREKEPDIVCWGDSSGLTEPVERA